MGIETDIERAIFFDIEGFGSAATYTPAGGDPVTVNGIFQNDYDEIDAGGIVGFAASSPTFHCNTTDVASAAEGDTLSVGGNSYVIRVVMDDGTGLTMLQLEAQ